MAWEICISTDGWTELREKLDSWSRNELIVAITDDTFEMVLEKAGQFQAKRAAAAERNRLACLPHDVLVDRAYELIEQNNTSDNGGFGFWIDREGCHKVWLD